MSKKPSASGRQKVFKEIGVPNREEHVVKAQLVFTSLPEQRASAAGVLSQAAVKMTVFRSPSFSFPNIIKYIITLERQCESSNKRPA